MEAKRKRQKTDSPEWVLTNHPGWYASSLPVSLGDLCGICPLVKTDQPHMTRIITEACKPLSFHSGTSTSVYSELFILSHVLDWLLAGISVHRSSVPFGPLEKEDRARLEHTFLKAIEAEFGTSDLLSIDDPAILAVLRNNVIPLCLDNHSDELSFHSIVMGSPALSPNDRTKISNYLRQMELTTRASWLKPLDHTQSALLFVTYEQMLIGTSAVVSELCRADWMEQLITVERKAALGEQKVRRVGFMGYEDMIKSSDVNATVKNRVARLRKPEHSLIDLRYRIVFPNSKIDPSDNPYLDKMSRHERRVDLTDAWKSEMRKVLLRLKLATEDTVNAAVQSEWSVNQYSARVWFLWILFHFVWSEFSAHHKDDSKTLWYVLASEARHSTLVSNISKVANSCAPDLAPERLVVVHLRRDNTSSRLDSDEKIDIPSRMVKIFTPLTIRDGAADNPCSPQKPQQQQQQPSIVHPKPSRPTITTEKKSVEAKQTTSPLFRLIRKTDDWESDDWTLALDSGSLLSEMSGARQFSGLDSRRLDRLHIAASSIIYSDGIPSLEAEWTHDISTQLGTTSIIVNKLLLFMASSSRVSELVDQCRAGSGDPRARMLETLVTQFDDKQLREVGIWSAAMGNRINSRILTMDDDSMAPLRDRMIRCIGDIHRWTNDKVTPRIGKASQKSSIQLLLSLPKALSDLQLDVLFSADWRDIILSVLLNVDVTKIKKICSWFCQNMESLSVDLGIWFHRLQLMTRQKFTDPVLDRFLGTGASWTMDSEWKTCILQSCPLSTIAETFDRLRFNVLGRVNDSKVSFNDPDYSKSPPTSARRETRRMRVLPPVGQIVVQCAHLLHRLQNIRRQAVLHFRHHFKNLVGVSDQKLNAVDWTICKQYDDIPIDLEFTKVIQQNNMSFKDWMLIEETLKSVAPAVPMAAFEDSESISIQKLREKLITAYQKKNGNKRVTWDLFPVSEKEAFLSSKRYMEVANGNGLAMSFMALNEGVLTYRHILETTVWGPTGDAVNYRSVKPETIKYQKWAKALVMTHPTIAEIDIGWSSDSVARWESAAQNAFFYPRALGDFPSFGRSWDPNRLPDYLRPIVTTKIPKAYTPMSDIAGQLCAAVLGTVGPEWMMNIFAQSLYGFRSRHMDSDFDTARQKLPNDTIRNAFDEFRGENSGFQRCLVIPLNYGGSDMLSYEKDAFAGGHWVLLVVDFAFGSILVYDSLHKALVTKRSGTFMASNDLDIVCKYLHSVLVVSLQDAAHPIRSLTNHKLWSRATEERDLIATIAFHLCGITDMKLYDYEGDPQGLVRAIVEAGAVFLLDREVDTTTWRYDYTSTLKSVVEWLTSVEGGSKPIMTWDVNQKKLIPLASCCLRENPDDDKSPFVLSDPLDPNSFPLPDTRKFFSKSADRWIVDSGVNPEYKGYISKPFHGVYLTVDTTQDDGWSCGQRVTLAVLRILLNSVRDPKDEAYLSHSNTKFRLIRYTPDPSDTNLFTEVVTGPDLWTANQLFKRTSVRYSSEELVDRVPIVPLFLSHPDPSVLFQIRSLSHIESSTEIHRDPIRPELYGVGWEMDKGVSPHTVWKRESYTESLPLSRNQLAVLHGLWLLRQSETTRNSNLAHSVIQWVTRHPNTVQSKDFIKAFPSVAQRTQDWNADQSSDASTLPELYILYLNTARSIASDSAVSKLSGTDSIRMIVEARL